MGSNAVPTLPSAGGRGRFRLSQFGGYDHRLGAQDGYIWDMENLTGDHAPVLASRPPRWTVTTVAKPNGLFCAGKRFLVDGTRLLVDGVEKGTVVDSQKLFAALSGRVVIWPDKVVYTTDGKLERLEAEYSAKGLVFGDGTFAGKPAKANSITTTGAVFPFRAGDGVTISGCAEAKNNLTLIVREISEDGKTLRFYENSFTLGSGSVTEAGTVTLQRSVPDFDVMCSDDNRLWGGKGDTIWCSKLGDPYNWNVFDGVSTDAWSVETGTPGNFTACTSFLGYPVFFKEDKVFKVYGDRPTNYQVMASATLGVSAGSGKSLAVAGETLFYLSRAGIVAYSGGIPRSISAPFGTARYRNAVGGSDGMKYYVSMEDDNGEWSLFVYDPALGVWHREDSTRLVAADYLGGVNGLTADGRLLLLGRPSEVPEGCVQEGAVRSWVEFGDIPMDSFDSKYPVRLWLRLSSDTAVTVAAEIQYDGGSWETVDAVKGGSMDRFYLSCPVQRCDHFRLRLSADGSWRLWGLEVELYDGSYVRK